MVLKMDAANRIVTLMLTLVFFSACSQPSEEAADEAGQAETASYAYNMSIDMKTFMNAVLEPPADVLWSSAGWILDEDGYHDLYPTTDQGWAAMRSTAALIVEAGNMLALPERALGRTDWLQYAEGLSNTGVAAMNAAEEQNEEAFFQAGAQLYSVCTACHQAYNADISRFVE